MPSHYYGLKLSTVVIKRRHKRLNFAKSVIELVSPVWSQVLTTCWSFNGTIQVVERLCCACVLCIVFCSYDRIFHKSITLCLPHVFWIYISSVQFCFTFFQRYEKSLKALPFHTVYLCRPWTQHVLFSESLFSLVSFRSWLIRMVCLIIIIRISIRAAKFAIFSDHLK